MSEHPIPRSAWVIKPLPSNQNHPILRKSARGRSLIKFRPDGTPSYLYDTAGTLIANLEGILVWKHPSGRGEFMGSNIHGVVDDIDDSVEIRTNTNGDAYGGVCKNGLFHLSQNSDKTWELKIFPLGTSPNNTIEILAVTCDSIYHCYGYQKNIDPQRIRLYCNGTIQPQEIEEVRRSIPDRVNLFLKDRITNEINWFTPNALGLERVGTPINSIRYTSNGKIEQTWTDVRGIHCCSTRVGYRVFTNAISEATPPIRVFRFSHTTPHVSLVGWIHKQ